METPLDLWLVIEAYDEVGHQLEEVLPQAQEQVHVEITDVHLAVDPRVIHVAHALETVDVVDAEASVHARVRGTFIHILLTPESQKRAVRTDNAGLLGGAVVEQVVRVQRRQSSCSGLRFDSQPAIFYYSLLNGLKDQMGPVGLEFDT